MNNSQILDKLEHDWFRLHREASDRVGLSQTLEDYTRDMATLIIADKNYIRVVDYMDAKKETL